MRGAHATLFDRLTTPVSMPVYRDDIRRNNVPTLLRLDVSLTRLFVVLVRRIRRLFRHDLQT